MNIFHKVTAKSLKKNRTRTIVTIIGIILSAAMITAVSSLVVSFQSYLARNAQWEIGDWYTGLNEVSAQDLDALEQDSRIDTLYSAQILGYAESASTNPDKPYLYVLGAKEDFLGNMGIHLVDGRLPKNSSEILLPLHLMSNGEVTFNIGDTWTLDMGYRDSEGYRLSQYNPYSYEEEHLEKTFSKTYTIVGSYERPEFEDYSAPGYTALSYWDEAAPVTSYEVYLKTANPRDAYLYPSTDMTGVGGTYNDALLMFVGASNHESYYSVLYGLATVIILLILLGSVSLIYNAFSISVSDRTKQFGLLSSIGATKKQLRSSVIYEALLVGGIGVPIGILCGLLGIGITLFFIGDYFSGMFFGSSGNSDISLSLQVSWQAILISFVIGMITVLISAWIPAKRATRVSAVEAVRGNQDIKISRKEVRVSRLNYVFFKLEGLLAKKYFKRDKKKYRSTVVSLFMSIVLFISSSAYILYLTGTAGAVMDVTSYDIMYHAEETAEENEKLFQTMSGVEGVQNSSMMSNYYGGVMQIDPSYISQTYREVVGVDDEGNVYLPSAYLLFVNDETFLRYLESVGEDPADYTDPEHPRAVLYDQVSVFYDERIVDLKILSGYPSQMSLDRSIIADEGETTTRSIDVEIGSYQESLPFGGDYFGNGACLLIYPQSVFETFLAADPVISDSGYSIMLFQAEEHEKVYEEMRGILMQNQQQSYRLSDERASQEVERGTILVINVLSYGFVVLIALIAVANVFNTISTNVALRRKDFAMLRSVGMTRKGFHRMMCYECLMYGTKALFWGLPVSILISLWLYVIVNSGWETNFLFPWYAVAISVVGVFVVVFATMMYAIRKIKKENLVDALKTDIQ